MDDLKFFGRGSGFNPAMGSTAAYFIEGNCLFSNRLRRECL